MDRVPTELLHEIFIKLDLKNRLVCMLVCRSWYTILDRCSLLYDLNITSKQCLGLKAIMESLPYRGAQTEYLTLRSYSRPNIDKRELLNMFPNLRELILKPLNNQHSEYHLDRRFHFANPTSNLERIEDYDKCELTRQLAMSNLCNNLKSLELRINCLNRSVRRSITTQLNNMPVLEHLSLNGPTVTLMDLETMHNNLPTIKSLSLDVDIDSGEIPRNVIPATLITKLHLNIGEVDNLNTHIQIYKYIYSKYSSAIELNIDDFELLYEAIDYVRDIYNEGIFPIYQRMGSQLETFLFKNYYNGLDAFRRFDDFGISFRNLTIISHLEGAILSLDELAQSQQSKSITTLTLEDIIPEPMSLMNNMEALTHLKISTYYTRENQEDGSIRTIDFCQLVEACPPTLSRLTLSGLCLTYNHATSNQTAIECLNLYHIRLKPELAKVIETSFPQLVQFRFEGDILDDVTISLPENNLDLLYIEFYYGEIEHTGVVLTTTNDNVDKYYAIGECVDYDGFLITRYNKLISVSKEEFHYNPVLHLTCACCKEFSLQIEYNYMY